MEIYFQTKGTWNFITSMGHWDWLSMQFRMGQHPSIAKFDAFKDAINDYFS